MTTDKVVNINYIDIKINAIGKIIVFILMFIFILSVNITKGYAAPDDTNGASYEVVSSDKYTTKESSGNFSVVINSGINGNAKLGRIAAINVDITNNGIDFEGYIRVGIPQNKEGTMYAKKINIASGKVGHESIYIPVNIQTGELKFEITTLEEKTCLKTNVPIKTYLSDVSTIGILADKPESLRYLLQERSSMCYAFTNNTMPNEYKDLDMLDMFVINNVNVGALNNNQFNAIKEWVLQGGTLVIGTGSGAGAVLNRFSKDFLDAKVSNVDTMDISIGNNMTDDNADKALLKTSVANIELNDAITIESASSRPIIQSVTRGKGKVIVCGFNLRIPNTYNKMQEGLSNTLYTYSSIESDTMYDRFIKTILESAKGNTPNAMLYIMLLGVYVVGICLVTIIYSRKSATNKVIKIIPIMALVVSVIIILIGFRTRINKMHSSHFSVLDLVGNGVVDVEKYYNITLPNNKNRELGLKEANYVLEVPKDMDDINVSSGSVFNTEITRDGDVTGIKLKGLAAFDTKTFESIGKYQTKMNLNANINCWEDIYSGVVENLTGHDLDYVFILTKSAIIYVGDVSKDEKVNQKAFKKLNYISINEFEELVPKLLDKKKTVTNSINSKGQITTSGITRILQYYMISKGVSASNEGRLLAITTSNEKTFVNKDIEEEGIGVITSTIPINYTSGSQEYIPNLCKENISFEMGKYYYSTTTNTVQLMDSVVAEYALDKTTKINSFKINGEDVVEDNSYFNGTVSLWNRVTNEYELVYDTKNKKDVTITDFTKYVGTNRIVKMKFDVAKESSGCVLPVIAVKVTK